MYHEPRIVPVRGYDATEITVVSGHTILIKQEVAAVEYTITEIRNLLGELLLALGEAFDEAERKAD